MIEAEYAIDLDTPVEDVWRYVEVIENWAPFMIGFQKLQIVNDRRSIWTLRGDVGILARDVDIQVDITTWEPMSRAEFQLTGLTERLAGSGRFELSAAPAAPAAGDVSTSAASGASTPAAAAAPDATASASDPSGPRSAGREGWWHRLQRRLAARLVRWLRRRSGPPAAPTTGTVSAAPTTETAAAAEASASRSAGGSHLVFYLQIAPQGPMAPMVELLMRPMVEPAAQDFLGNLRRALEGKTTDVDTN